MANITFTIPDAYLARVIAAFTEGYEGQDLGAETKRRIIAYIKDKTAAHEGAAARATATATVQADNDGQTIT